MITSEETENFLGNTSSDKCFFQEFETGGHFLLESSHKQKILGLVVNWLQELKKTSILFDFSIVQPKRRFQKTRKTQYIVMFCLVALYVKGLQMYRKKSEEERQDIGEQTHLLLLPNLLLLHHSGGGVQGEHQFVEDLPKTNKQRIGVIYCYFQRNSD